MLPTESIQLPISTNRPISIRGQNKIKVMTGFANYRIKAVRVGQVLLSSDDHIFFIFIYKPDVYSFVKEAEALVKTMRGLEIKFSKEGPIIQGELLHILDLIELSELALKHSQEFIFQADMSKNVFESLELHFKQFEHKNNMSSIKLMEDKGSYYLNSTSQKMNTYHKQYLKSFGIRLIYNTTKVKIEPMVEISMHITELRRSGFLRFGIQWPSVYQATILPRLVGSQIESALTALEESGNGQTLARPRLICRSGGEARFLAGGEIPIRTFSYRSQGIIWKTYGIGLSFKPVANKTGQLKVQLETELSSIDSSQTIDGIPAFFTNRMASEFNLESSKTIALSGLTTYFQGQSTKGIPLLKHIPILGKLFSSKDYQDKKTELLILVSPKVIYE